MPTLMNIPVSHTLAGDKATSIDGFRAEHDGSITLLGDESTIIDEDYRPQNKNNKTEVDHGDELSSPFLVYGMMIKALPLMTLC